MSDLLIDASEVTVTVGGSDGVRPVRGVSLSLRRGETLGLVGESGCGKSLTGYSMLGLLPSGLRASGQMTFDGTTYGLDAPQSLAALRGSEISFIAQDPLSALNPVLRVGNQISDVLKSHTDWNAQRRREQVLDLLRRVGFASPKRVADSYPFELSGGMRQRVVIAMAISCSPKLVIADEPTTALDTTVQAAIMTLMRDLVREEHLALILITHNLGLVAENCDRVAVMYAGQVVEEGHVADVLETPNHPYTAALLSCVESMNDADTSRLDTIEGVVPDPASKLPGCRFAPRCAFALPQCSEGTPHLDVAQHPGRVACFRSDELADGFRSTTS